MLLTDNRFMNTAQFIFIANFVATIFMTGLIWMVQVVHYPLFNDVGPENYIQYQLRHQTNITFIVGPVMLIELFTAILMAWYPMSSSDRWTVYVGIALVAVIWLSTASLQIPCHQKLSQGFDQAVYNWLVRSNWIRTIAWTARGVLMTVILNQLLSRIPMTPQ